MLWNNASPNKAQTWDVRRSFSTNDRLVVAQSLDEVCAIMVATNFVEAESK